LRHLPYLLNAQTPCQSYTFCHRPEDAGAVAGIIPALGLMIVKPLERDVDAHP